MGFKTIPISTDMTYYLEFIEPQLQYAGELERISLIKNILSTFEVKFEQLKFDLNLISRNYIHVARLYDDSYFDLSIGIEYVVAKLNKPPNTHQAFEIFNKVFQLFEPTAINLQEITKQQHLSSEKVIFEYLESLNPNYPTKFKDFIKGMGVQYNLRFEGQATVLVSVADSILHDNAIFLSTTCRQESQLNFEQTKDKFIIHRCFILEELGLEIEEV